MIIGPVAGVVMGTAPVMPRGLDLPFMSLLFRGRRAPEAFQKKEI